MIAFFSGVVAICKAIPILNDLLQEFFAYYAKTQLAAMKEANREGVRKAVYEHDQRELEKTIGSDKAGEPSGHGDIVDTLPGV